MARAAPENAPTLAVPLCELATKRTVALPPCVRASFGSMLPNDEVNVTTVPFWTGVPADSVTDAVISADPLTGTTVVLEVSVIVDSVGASRGTLSQADRKATAMSSANSVGWGRDTDKASKDNRRMGLAGQGRSADQRGYAMAALLVSMSVMAVLMGAALPVWSHATQREREEELIWRGEQYRRAIMLFQRKYANTFPPTLDILVEQKFLRKKYKDPVTDDDFQIIPVGGAQPGVPGLGGRPGGSTQPGATQPGGTRPGGAQAGGTQTGGTGRSGGSPTSGFGSQQSSGFGSQQNTGFGSQQNTGFGSQQNTGFGSQPNSGFGSPQNTGFGGQQNTAGGAGSFGQPAGTQGGFGSGTPGTQLAMGIQGVTSKSKKTSIKLYNGMNTYNQWAFVYLASSGQAGAGGQQFGQTRSDRRIWSTRTDAARRLRSTRRRIRATGWRLRPAWRGFRSASQTWKRLRAARWHEPTDDAACSWWRLRSTRWRVRTTRRTGPTQTAWLQLASVRHDAQVAPTRQHPRITRRSCTATGRALLFGCRGSLTEIPWLQERV